GAPAGPEVEQLDEVRVDVQLVAIRAQAAWDAEAQPLTLVGQPKRCVEPGAHQEPGAGGTSISSGGHAPMLRPAPSGRHDPSVPSPPVPPPIGAEATARAGSSSPPTSGAQAGRSRAPAA